MWAILGFSTKNYQKQVVKTLMHDVLEEKGANRKLKISWRCPRDHKVCRMKEEMKSSENWTNLFKHLVSVHFIISNNKLQVTFNADNAAYFIPIM